MKTSRALFAISALTMLPVHAGQLLFDNADFEKGTLENWDRTEELAQIQVPTLVIGAQHDTMDPAYMEMMAGRLPNGRYLHCPNGSHMAMYDDQQTYFDGLIDFLLDVGR